MWDGNVLVIRPRYVNVPGEPSWALPDRSVAWAAWRSRRQWEGATAIHGHYAITGLAAWRVARRTGLPFFLTFHGDDMNASPDEHPDRRADLLAAVSDARGVFAVSRALADRVHDVTGVTAIPLPLGCDHEWIQQASLPRAEARRLLGLPEDPLIVLFVGYLQRQKGVRNQPQRSSTSATLSWRCSSGTARSADTGRTIPAHRGACSTWGRDRRGRHPVHVPPPMSLCCPRMAKGSRRCLSEAGSMGLPVVASAVGGIPELLGGERGTLLPSVSAPAIATSSLLVCRTSTGGERRRGTPERARARRVRRPSEREGSPRALPLGGRSLSDGAPGQPYVGSMTGGRLRIAMVLHGDITFDSRVQREANSLVQAGHSVTLFCLEGSHVTAPMLDPRVDPATGRGGWPTREAARTKPIPRPIWSTTSCGATGLARFLCPESSGPGGMQSLAPRRHSTHGTRTTSRVSLRQAWPDPRALPSCTTCTISFSRAVRALVYPGRSDGRSASTSGISPAMSISSSPSMTVWLPTSEGAPSTVDDRRPQLRPRMGRAGTTARAHPGRSRASPQPIRSSFITGFST